MVNNMEKVFILKKAKTEKVYGKWVRESTGLKNEL